MILASQGQSRTANAAATRRFRYHPSHPAALIRARVRVFAGDNEGARADITRGLSIQPDEPGLLELKGVLSAGPAITKPRGGNSTTPAPGRPGRIHLHKAATLDALGRTEAAIQEWSLALRRDPELPKAYLGRARAHVKLRQWEMAFANLEQAAAWAHSDPAIELGIAWTYLKCLPERPDRLPRFLTLAVRAASDLWAASAVPLIQSRLGHAR